MKIFDDMTYSGKSEALALFIQRLDRAGQVGPWKRDRQAEESHALVRPAPDTDHCFRTVPESGLPHAFLWFFPQENKTAWRVTNIVPVEQNASFSEETYYSLLMSFRDATLPLAKEVGVTISTPRLHVGPEYWLTPHEQELLQAFSQHANRSTGSAHPRDRERWNAFVIAVHHAGTPVSGSELQRILVEHDQWPESTALELAIEFDRQLSLLRDFAKSA